MDGFRTHTDIATQIQREIESNSHILPEIELEAAQTSIGVARNNIAVLSLEIERLRAKKREEREILRKLEIAVAPIKHIPPEILAEIFVHALKGKRITLSIKRHDSQMPWVLLRVCSLWRQVALAERRLWNRVLVRIGPSGDDCVHDVPWYPDGRSEFHDALKCWNDQLVKTLTEEIFPRCGKLSLALKDTGEGAVNVHQTQYYLPSLVVGTCLPRLRELVLHLPADALPSFYDLLPDAFSSIESMRLRFDEENVIDPPWHIEEQMLRDTKIFTKASSLRTFFLQTDWYLFALPHIFPWKQLLDVEIHLTNLKFSEVLNVLSACVNCRRSVFKTDVLYHASVGTSYPITLPHIQHLGLHGFNHIALNYLSLPSLTSLDIKNDWDVAFEPKIFTSLIERSKCALRQLDYNSCKIPTPQSSQLLHPCDRASFNTLLALLPSLRELRMPYVVFQLPTLDLVTHGKLLPLLAILECNISWDNTPHFVDLVERRLYRPQARDHSSNHGHSLREAVGYYMLNSSYLANTMDAHKRIDNLRQEQGRRLDLVRRWSPQ